MQHAQVRSNEHRAVLGQQGLGYDEGERSSQHAVEDAYDRRRVVHCQQNSHNHVRVNDNGLAAHDLQRAASTSSWAMFTVWTSESLLRARTRRTRWRASSRDWIR